MKRAILTLAVVVTMAVLALAPAAMAGSVETTVHPSGASVTVHVKMYYYTDGNVVHVTRYYLWTDGGSVSTFKATAYTTGSPDSAYGVLWNVYAGPGTTHHDVSMAMVKDSNYHMFTWGSWPWQGPKFVNIP
jgi:hypothetical protein